MILLFTIRTIVFSLVYDYLVIVVVVAVSTLLTPIYILLGVHMYNNPILKAAPSVGLFVIPGRVVGRTPLSLTKRRYFLERSCSILRCLLF